LVKNDQPTRVVLAEVLSTQTISLALLAKLAIRVREHGQLLNEALQIAVSAQA